MNIKLHLYTSVVLPTAIYAGETWTSVAKTRHLLGVFNRRCLQYPGHLVERSHQQRAIVRKDESKQSAGYRIDNR